MFFPLFGLVHLIRIPVRCRGHSRIQGQQSQVVTDQLNASDSSFFVPMHTVSQGAKRASEPCTRQYGGDIGLKSGPAFPIAYESWGRASNPPARNITRAQEPALFISFATNPAIELLINAVGTAGKLRSGRSSQHDHSQFVKRIGLRSFETPSAWIRRGPFILTRHLTLIYRTIP